MADPLPVSVAQQQQAATRPAGQEPTPAIRAVLEPMGPPAARAMEETPQLLVMKIALAGRPHTIAEQGIPEPQTHPVAAAVPRPDSAVAVARDGR